MKKINDRFLILPVIITSLYLTIIPGCKKSFLEVADKTVLLKEAYVTDLKTTEEYLNGMYLQLALYFSATKLPYAEIVADNVKPAIGSSTLAAQYNWVQQAGITDESNSNSFWGMGYRIVRGCSFVIESADKFERENKDWANNIKGQALGVRALVHFFLVNQFAQPYNYTPDGSHQGIPYVKTFEGKISKERPSVNTVFEDLILDINQALTLLPREGNRKDVMNFYAAKSLLARFYLFKRDYLQAKKHAIEVLDKIPIMQEYYPEKLYTSQETEALFQLPPGLKDGYIGVFMGAYSSSPLLFYYATNDIAELLQESPIDKRAAWVVNQSGDWIISKFPRAVTGSVPFPAGDYFQTLVRASEMSLTAAEAFAMLKQEDSARLFLDQTRIRANSALERITASGNALMDSIYKERRKELSFDGLRLFDLLRWGKPVDRKDALSNDKRYLPFPSEMAISPIPLQDVELSSLTQNPGY